MAWARMKGWSAAIVEHCKHPYMKYVSNASNAP